MKRASVHPYFETEAPGATIHAFRHEMGWSVNELGEKAGVHYTTISRIERNQGYKKPTLEKIVKGLNAGGLNLNLADLFIPPDIAKIAMLPPEHRDQCVEYINDKHKLYGNKLS